MRKEQIEPRLRHDPQGGWFLPGAMIGLLQNLR